MAWGDFWIQAGLIGGGVGGYGLADDRLRGFVFAVVVLIKREPHKGRNIALSHPGGNTKLVITPA